MEARDMKALVLAGQEPQAALIRELKSRGITTVLADWGANPIAKADADIFYQESTLDIPKITEIAKKEKVDFLLTVCTDQALLTVAKVSEDLGLPCYIDYQTALNVTNKQYMKKVFVEHQIPSAQYVIFGEGELSEAAVSHLRYPVVVKPVDCNSSKGVQKAYDFAELEVAFDKAWRLSRTQTAIIEEFITGDELSVDAWVEDGKVDIQCITLLEKVGMDDRFVIWQSRYPAKETEVVREKIRDAVQKIADAFGLKNTPMLIQLISTGEDVYVLEFSARNGGGGKHISIKQRCGVDVIKGVADLTLGIKPDVKQKYVDQKHMAVSYFYAYSGVFDHAEGLEELKQASVIYSYDVTVHKGEELDGRVESSSDRVGSFTVWTEDGKSMEENYRKAIAQMHFYDAQGNDLLRHDILSNVVF